MDDPGEAKERERWRIAFERCDGGRCCTASSYHRPRCERRAEYLKERAQRVADAVARYTPSGGVRNEWSGYGRALVLVGVVIAVAVTIALVAYR